MATTNLDKLRDNLIDLLMAHNFRKLNCVEDENGTTVECLDPVPAETILRMAKDMLEIVGYEVEEEEADFNDISIKIVK